MQENNNKFSQKKWTNFILFIPLIFYFYFSLQHITQFETVDEHYWIYSKTVQNNYWHYNDGRIHQYWEAISTGNWAMTRINDKPGITLAYVSGIGSWLKTNLEKQIGKGAISVLSNIDKAEKINLYFRLPILIFNGLFSIALFYLLRKLLGNDWISLFATTFILLSPIIVGISQIVNPDALLWEFNFAAILSFLIFLKNSSKKYAVWSALFLGLALLTKYSSVILIPFFLAVMIAYIFENIDLWEKELTPKKIKFYAFLYFLIIAGGLLMYAVILPDNIIEFRHFMKGSLGFKEMQWFFLLIFLINLFIFLDAQFIKSRALTWLISKLSLLDMEKCFKIFFLFALPLIFIIIIINTLFGKDWLQLFAMPFDASTKNIFSKLSTWKIFLMQFLPITFSLTPLVILGMFYIWLKNIIKQSLFQWIIFIFSSFIIVFVLAAMQQKLLLTIRYSIVLYPILMTLASIGIYQIFTLNNKSTRFKFFIFFAIIFISVISLFKSKPFYFNYTNFLLPKNYLITDAWGYGGYEAAEVLNKLPDAENLRVWSDFNGFCLFFSGKCIANNLTMKNIQKESKDLSHFDYFVSSRRGQILSKTLWKTLPEKYQSKSIWSTIINNRPENFVNIYENNIYKSN